MKWAERKLDVSNPEAVRTSFVPDPDHAGVGM